MKELFDAVLTASISGGIIIALILVLRLFLKAAPRRYVCLLWLLAAARLLVPLNIESSLSLQPKVEQITVQREDAAANTVTEVSGIEVDFGVSAVVVPSVSVQIPSEQMDPWLTESGGQVVYQQPTDIMPAIWFAAACGFLIYTAVSYAALKHRVRNAICVDGNVYECSAITAPFLLGYFRPRIYLPVGLSAGDLEHILAHERAHIRRLDNWTKLLGFLCLAVHWFNPLVWAAYILLCRDMEMACDEAVVRDMNLEDRKSYSRALVNCAANMGLVSACPVAFGEVSVKARILKVLNYRRPVFWISLIAVAAIVFVAVCFMTSPAEQEPLTGMEWLQSLDAEDVAAIRFSVAENPLSYTDYAQEEIADILGFLQSCDGIPIEGNYLVSLGQQPRYYYVTMQDGTVHTLIHMGDHVEIDGIPYHECDEWLAQWPAEGRVQADMVQWALELLERERTRESFYMNTWSLSGESVPKQTWRRSGDDWWFFADDNGECTALLTYDGRQFRSEYAYIGPDYRISNTGWVETSLDETFELPWPLNEKQDPADYTYMGTDDFEGQISVTLRYEPDGTLVQLQCWASGWLSHYDLEYPDGTVVRCSFLDPNSAGTEYVLQSYYLEATGQLPDYMGGTNLYTREELETQAERCRVALAEFQAAESYSLIQTDRGYDSIGLETTLLIWNSGDNWLRQYQAEVRTYSYLQYEGRQYQKYNSTTMVTPWTEADLSGEADCRDTWLREFQWDPEKIYCDAYSDDAEHEGYTWISLFVLDDAVQGGYYDLHFVLDVRGNIYSVNKSWTVGENIFSRYSAIYVYYHDGNAVADYIADAYQEATAE